MPPPRQTQNYLRSLFEQRGIAPKRSLGQNFLIDLNIHETIVRTAAIAPGDLILEIGSGTGALTTLMASRGATVIAVEVDRALAKLTAEATAGMPRVTVIEADALKSKSTLNPLVLDAIRSGLSALPGRPFKLVANLPYNVATPLISNLLLHNELCPALLVATIQREMADRLVAEPGSKAYGAVSVLVSALADVAIERNLPPSVFWPRPKVDSAIVVIQPKPANRAAIGDIAWFHSIVRRMFLHRRKAIRLVLQGMWSDHWTKADVDRWLDDHGLSGQIRPEALNAEEFADLARALHQEPRLATSNDRKPTPQQPQPGSSQPHPPG